MSPLAASAEWIGKYPVLWSNRHRSFNSARGNKAFWPNGHLKRDATTNTLISYGYSGIWWRLLHNTVNTTARPNGVTSRSKWLPLHSIKASHPMKSSPPILCQAADTRQFET